MRRAAFALLLAAVAATPSGVAAQVVGSVRPSDPSLGSDPQALLAFDAAMQGDHVRARELAEALLARRPQSYEGHFVLGYVLHVAEANLPLAYHQLRRARELFEREHGRTPAATAPWRWHLAMLEELSSVTREMDRFEETLAILDAHDAAYDPDEIASRGWPLMRLRRYDEARAIVQKALASDDARQQQIARTALCAIEAELQRRQEAWEACSQALGAEPAAQAGPHLYTNAASSALSLLRHDETERLLLEGTRHFEEGNAANPWQDLMLLYIDQGRTGEALGAVREMVSWSRAQPPFMDDQTRAGTDFAAALFLLVAGKGTEAVRVTDRILARPDRTGFTSAESAQGEAGTALLSRAALRLAAERRAEEASFAAGMDRVRAWLDVARLRFEAWQSGRRAARLVSERMLVSTLRPYLPGGVSLPNWMVPDLVSVLGAGVVTAGLEQARRLEELEGARAYFDAIGAEAALERGRAAEAVALAERALAALPRSEVLLQARVTAVAALAAAQGGDDARAAGLFARALQQDPGVIRRLGAALPVSIESTGDPVSRDAAELLGRSPRLDAGGGGLRVQVRSAGRGAEACLVGPNGENLGCGGVAQAGPTSSTDELARQVCAHFHEQVFAARVDLTQADLRSLDGSPTVTRERTEQKMQGVLDALGVER